MGSQTVRTRDEFAADECATRLVEVAPLTVRFIRAEMRKRIPGLTMPQFRSLAFLYRRGGCSLSELAEHLGVALPTASALVERLVRGGLVTRDMNIANRRQVALRLTGEGITRFELAKDAARQHIARLLSSLPERSLQIVHRSLDLLAEVFAQQGGNAPR